MRKMTWTVLFLTAATLCACTKSTPDTDQAKSTILFNGKDVSDWRTREGGAAGWKVEDGVLHVVPKTGDIVTEKKLMDHYMHLEFRCPDMPDATGQAKGNSGVFIRVRDLAEPVTTGIEVQINDSHDKAEPLGPHDCGGVIRTIGPTKNMAKPAGQWNHMVVTCRGTRLQVEFNGEQVVDVALDESEVKDRPLKGHVGLQDHGQEIEFRNVKIREL